MGFVLEGLEQMMRALGLLDHKVDEATRDGLTDAAKRIVIRGKEYAPKVTGRLANSDFIDPGKDGVAFGFGKGVPYAATVHEGMGRGRKFLSRAVETEAGTAFESVAVHVGKVKVL